MSDHVLDTVVTQGVIAAMVVVGALLVALGLFSFFLRFRQLSGRPMKRPARGRR
jgi:hypothetical protein